MIDNAAETEAVALRERLAANPPRGQTADDDRAEGQAVDVKLETFDFSRYATAGQLNGDI